MSKIKFTKTGNKIFDTGWQPLVLQNGWVNYGDKFTQAVNQEYSYAAYRCVNGVTYLQGLIVPPTAYIVGQPTILSTSIPQEYLPSHSKLYRFTNNHECRVSGWNNGYSPKGISVLGDFTDIIVDLSIISWPVD